jgi:hypothetical protein
MTHIWSRRHSYNGRVSWGDNPNPPFQPSLWEKTGVPAEDPRLSVYTYSVDWLFSHCGFKCSSNFRIYNICQNAYCLFLRNGLRIHSAKFRFCKTFYSYPFSMQSFCKFSLAILHRRKWFRCKIASENLQKLDACTCVAPSLFKRLKFQSQMRIILIILRVSSWFSISMKTLHGESLWLNLFIIGYITCIYACDDVIRYGWVAWYMGVNGRI